MSFNISGTFLQFLSLHESPFHVLKDDVTIEFCLHENKKQAKKYQKSVTKVLHFWDHLMTPIQS